MGRPKKVICTVINDLSYDQRMQRICTTLVEAGYEVVLVGREKEKSIKLSEQIFVQKRIDCMTKSGFLMYMEFNIRLFLYLLFHRFDIVNAVDLDTIIPTSLVARLKSKPLVYDAHELFTEVPEIVSRLYQHRFWTLIEKTFVPKAKKCYTVCKSLANIFEDRYGKSFSVIRNVPFRKKLAVLKKDRKIILYQGAVNTGRGLKEMIAAMPMLDEKIVLWIVGDGDEYEEINNLANASSAKHRIKLFGYLEPKELKGITSKAWIGINILENIGLSYYYSLANRTFDFIQSGIPAIHINFPEYKSINDKYQIAELVDDLSTQSIVKAVSKLSEDAHYDLLQQNCIKAAEELCWEEEKDKLVEIYNTFNTI